MKYYDSISDLFEIIPHLRNKNLTVLPGKRGLIEGILYRFGAALDRLWRLVYVQRGFQVVVSEQIVENAMVMRHLQADDRDILDFGAFESILPLSLSALGHRVTVLDQRRYPFRHPNLTVLCRDIFDATLAIDRQYDVVLSISTVEHLGLGGYNDMIMPDADCRGVEVLWNLVRPGGRLMISVPAGRPVIQRGYRVYDQQRIEQVFPHATTVAWFYKEGREGIWRQADATAVSDIVYDDPNGVMPVQAVAFVICEKPSSSSVSADMSSSS